MDTLNTDRLGKLEGIGCSRKRREDPRFIQGKGNYVDDIKMPHMLFGIMVRSPYAHARILKIDTSRCLRLQAMSRPCWPTKKSASRIRKSLSWWPTTVTSQPMRLSW